MSVINSEYARSVGLNGRLKKGGKHVEVRLLPGLNNVSEEEMQMLRENSTFTFHCESNKMSVIEHSDKDEAEEPLDINSIDITSMSVAKGGIAIDSAVTIELLDKFQEQEEAGEGRKGILGAIEKQREEVERIMDLHKQANKTEV